MQGNFMIPLKLNQNLNLLINYQKHLEKSKCFFRGQKGEFDEQV